MAGYRDTVVKFLKSKGLSDVAIAGILGNIMVESSFNPAAYNDGEGAVGFAQWEGGRRSALQEFARKRVADETDAMTQLEFMWHELTTTYRGALDAIKSASTPADAAAAFDQLYEVSSGSSRQQRVNYAAQFYQGSGPNPDFAGPVHNGAGGTGSGGSSGGGGVDSSSPPTMADYQGVDSIGALLDRVPELNSLVNQALAHDWSPDKFKNALEDSKWWKSHSDSARSVIIQQANDPATYNQSLANVKNSISGLAHQLGMPLTAAELNAIASNALLTNNSTNQQWITQQIGRHQDYSHLTSTGGLQGGMANTVQQLQSLAGDYGYTWTPSQLGRYAQSILMGNQTIDTYKQSLIRWAKSTFPGLQQELDSGQTVKDLANPYIQSMSNLLEVDPNTLTVYDPKIRRALQGAVDPSTKVRAATPLWQFEDQLRTDPRWAYTQNAKDTISTALVKIGHDFGFSV